MNVLHISMWDNLGGSGRAAYRLHTGMKRLGVHSRMLVGGKKTTDPDVQVIGGAFHSLDKWIGRSVDAIDLHSLFYPSSLYLPWMQWVREADIIQLFNAHGGYFSHRSLPALSRRRPIIWRLSDMWALTGHCSYSYECERWKVGCGECPHLEEYPSLRRDTSAFLWRVKEKIYKDSRLSIVTPSRWLEGLARQSPLLNRFPIRRIPNGLDTEVFKPLHKLQIRERFELPLNKPVILFSASSLALERKGASFLKEALMQLAYGGVHEITLLVVGGNADRWMVEVPFPVKLLGDVSDDETLAALYSAADLFVLPTLADNLPNGILESMACGTPVVSFDVGGVSEAVRHMESGYLARPKDAQDLAHGIKLLLTDDQLRIKMGQQCRWIAQQEYPLELQAHRFEQFYQELLSQRAPTAEAPRRSKRSLK